MQQIFYPMQKLKLAILFGGKSAEHEVSIRSAQSIYREINKTMYDLYLVRIDKQGLWWLVEGDDLEHPALQQAVALIPSVHGAVLLDLETAKPLVTLDVAFPVLHGSFGEDGTIQGLFKMMDLPFVGTGVLASSVCMDKDICKRLLREAGLDVAPGLVVTVTELAHINYAAVVAQVGSPFFVKPANAGSSVGVHKVKNEADFDAAMQDAFQYDQKVLIETFIRGREVECAVLGNGDPQASVVGEIIPQTEFYSYESKYLNADGAILKAPADLNVQEAELIRSSAIKAFKAVNGEGLSRVDFFLTSDGKAIVNEINTLPGFTSISMYPKLWELTGVPYSQLIDHLIDLALQRAGTERKYKTDFL